MREIINSRNGRSLAVCTVASRKPGNREPVVLILDGNSEIGGQVRSNLCYLICLRHLIRSEQSHIGFLFRKKDTDLHDCAACSELPSNISSMILTRDLETCIFICGFCSKICIF